MLEKYGCLIKNFKQAGLYLLTVVGLIYSADGVLGIADRGIENLQIEYILFNWPVLFLFIALPMLLISVFVSFGDRQRAAKIAFWGAIFGWGYIILTACAGFMTVTFFAFILLIGFLRITLPGVLLYVTTVYSRRIQRQV